MAQYLQDILSQATAIRNELGFYRSAENQKILTALADLNKKRVVFLGMGSSNFCAYGASIILNQAGINCRTESASQVLHYELASIGDDDLVVLTSQSGESAEIVALVSCLPESIDVLGICNFPDSTLGKRAKYLLSMNVKPEEAVSTRTYLASLILTQLLAVTLVSSDTDVFFAHLDQALTSLAALLQEQSQIVESLQAFVEPGQTVAVIGRGYGLGTARAGALFIREAAKFPALDFESAEFRHGPFEMVDSRLCALILAPEGPGYTLQIALARDIIERGGKVILVASTQVDIAKKNCLLIKTGPLYEALSGLVQIVPIHLLAYVLAQQSGFEPGVFRWSSKVTSRE